MAPGFGADAVGRTMNRLRHQWPLRIALPLALLALLLGGLYVVADAQGLQPAYSRWYPAVFIATLLALLLLTLAIIQQLWRLRRQLRRGEPGARLSRRLLMLLVLLALPPLLLVYGFGARFITSTVDSWLPANSVPALQDALVLGQSYLDDHIGQARNTTDRIAAQLAVVGDLGLDLALEDALDAHGARQLAVFESDGRLRAVAADDPALLLPGPPQDEARLALRNRSLYSATERVGEGLRIRVLARLGADRSLQALFDLPDDTAARVLRVEAAVHAAARAQFLRESLKVAFILILSLVLVISLFATVLVSFGLARRLVAPIARLSTATRLVAEGRFDAQLPEGQDDELGFLVRSFNRMTRELELARARANASAEETERQRAFLETVLAHLSSGVLVVDGSLQLRSMNAAARQMLGLAPDRHGTWPLTELRRIAPRAAPLVTVLLQRLREGAREWREEVALDSDDDGPRVLLLRGARLPDEGAVAVFDDATVIDRARRDAAWAEVARRLAHEIKNPLTPIQLAAERLRRRVLPKLDEDDAQVLDRATNTIVAQVDALKTMVNSFGDYARPPSLALLPLDLNTLAGQVLDLYEHDQRLLLVRDFADSLPAVTADAGRIRQVLHNLIKNAIEAGAERSRSRIEISTREVSERDRRFVELTVGDDGPGLPEGFDMHWFEPYRSTKPRGTGLGLAIVARIAQEHGAQFFARHRDNGGACFVLRLPLA
ncbi:ATP-binding protein [Denitratimonas sp. CY0512]|uniref:sensor histidine kinase n=1 Tax=Denitratimonas sp. CY0512 TaxID=3131940 RepID=UPI0030B722E7